MVLVERHAHGPHALAGDAGDVVLLQRHPRAPGVPHKVCEGSHGLRQGPPQQELPGPVRRKGQPRRRIRRPQQLVGAGAPVPLRLPGPEPEPTPCPMP